MVVDRREVGTIWIERWETWVEPRLGVFLGDPDDFGRGIGREALGLAIAEFRAVSPEAVVSLHVRRTNRRAMACYRAVGFEVVSSGTKILASGDEVAFVTMILSAETPLPGSPVVAENKQFDSGARMDEVTRR